MTLSLEIPLARMLLFFLMADDYVYKTILQFIGKQSSCFASNLGRIIDRYERVGLVFLRQHASIREGLEECGPWTDALEDGLVTQAGTHSYWQSLQVWH